MGLTCTQISREINTDSPKQSKVWGPEDISLACFLVQALPTQFPITLPLSGQLRELCIFSGQNEFSFCPSLRASTSELVGSLFCLRTSLSYVPGC